MSFGSKEYDDEISLNHTFCVTTNDLISRCITLTSFRLF